MLGRGGRHDAPRGRARRPRRGRAGRGADTGDTGGGGVTPPAPDAQPHVAPPPGGPAEADEADEPVEPAAGTAIVPGSVDRGSIRMTATYDVRARLAVAARSLRGSVTITARNDSGAGVDRVRLNTVMGPLGGLDLGGVTVDGEPARATLDDQTITVRLGGVLPDGASAVIRVPFHATLRSTIGGSTWLFTRANGVVSMYRWVPWISRSTPFDRPNHGDPFVTPVSPSVTLRIRTDVPTRVVVNGTRTSRSDDGLVTTWALRNVRDVIVNAASDYRTASREVGDTTIRVHTRPGEPSAAILDAAASARPPSRGPAGAVPVERAADRPVGRRVRHGGPGHRVDPGRGRAHRTCATSSPTRSPTSGSTGWSATTRREEPFADEAMADMVARFVIDARRGSRCTAGRLDRSIYDYGSTCYYERIYIQGGNLLDDARRRMGNRAFFGALRGYVRAERWELSHTRTLLDAIDDATPLNLANGWRTRFPSLY